MHLYCPREEKDGDFQSLKLCLWPYLLLSQTITGPTAYATSANAYLIPVLPYPDKLGYVIPDGTALTLLMKQVIVDTLNVSKSASRKGELARVDMQKFSPQVVADAVIVRIRKLAAARGWYI